MRVRAKVVSIDPERGFIRVRTGGRGDLTLTLRRRALPASARAGLGLKKQVAQAT